MKRFRYRLQKVLQVRERIRDETLRELMGLNNQLLTVKRDRDELISAFLSNRIEEGRIVSQAELMTAGAYAARLKEQLAIAEERVVEAQKAVDEATTRYVEASKEAKVLTTHKEKKLAEYKDEVFKDEERFLDELATQRAAKRLNE